MNERQDFSFLVEDVSAQVGQQLADRCAGIEGPGTIAELEDIQQELTGLIEKINENNLPLPDQRRLSSTHIVIDSWPPTEKLGERICMIGYLYRNILE